MLPYPYVLNAILYCDTQRQEELHEMERPIASLSALVANSNRDSKKQPKPFESEDFYWYKTAPPGKYPGARYGAAGMEMVKQGLFPAWALFAYKDLKVNAGEATAPEPLYLGHEHALILGPVFSDGMVHGMLIAQHAASGKTLTMSNTDGRAIRVAMPKIESAVVAEEDVSLRVFT